MRQYFAILVAFSVSLPLYAGAGPVGKSVNPASPVVAAESAALFVGVREFTFDKTLAEVRYAVDDAIGLAYVMAFEREPHLIEPSRVVLALSGEPQTAASREELKQLLAAGATRRGAGHSELLTLLDAQAASVGPNGILIVSFATHGVSEEGVQSLLASDSLLLRRGTKITDAEVEDAVSRAGVKRALILLDACRQQLTKDIRAGEADPRSKAALLQDLASIEGRVVISAAAVGKYAYDDEAQGHGVFTAAIIEGLRCGAPVNDRGYVTVDTLSAFVEDRVLQWIRRNRDRDARVATQLRSEGASKRMPLVVCVNGRPAASARLP